MKHLDVKQIEEIIPHRHPFLLVDYIEDYEPGEFAVGYKCVTFREDCLVFPASPFA
jgi:3-hydroxyacyl-[acyl-carrier-protein] dehydratase